jgi:hypothetical protein
MSDNIVNGHIGKNPKRVKFPNSPKGHEHQIEDSRIVKNPVEGGVGRPHKELVKKGAREMDVKRQFVGRAKRRRMHFLAVVVVQEAADRFNDHIRNFVVSADVSRIAEDPDTHADESDLSCSHY